MLIARTGRLTFGLALLVSSSLLSQQRGVEFGLVGGVNHNTMTGVGPVDAGVAGQAGLFAQFHFSSHVGFRPEMSVSWKRLGTSMGSMPIPLLCPQGMSCGQSFALDQTTSLTWLEVPLLAQVSLPALGGNVVPRLIAGPYVAIRLACSVSSTSFSFPYDLPVGVEPPGAQVTVSQSCSDASPQSYGNGDAGYILGAGLAMRQFGIGIRWTRSLVATVPFNGEFGSSPLTGGKQSTLALTIDVAIK
jgi:hypothetical protein